MLDKYPTLSTGIIPVDICIELVRPIYEKEKVEKQKSLEVQIEKAGEDLSHAYASWQALGDGYEELYLSKKADLVVLKEKLVSLRDDDVLSNPDSAYDFLVTWHNNCNLSEAQTLNKISEWFSVIKEFSSDLANAYVHLLKEFFETNNLRYIIKRNGDVVDITLNPAFISSERFLTVRENHCDSKHLKDLYIDFENTFGDLFRNHTSTQVKNTIGSSSNLIEALANRASGQSGQTLSGIIRAHLPADCFPHADAKETLSKMYGFFSDYPGIRHGGTAGSITRDLSERDAFLFGSMSVLFADYLSRTECPICGGDMIIKDSGTGKEWECLLSPGCAGVKVI